MERWLPVAGWPDYEVSDHGRVLSVTHSLSHLELYDSILVLHEGRGDLCTFLLGDEARSSSLLGDLVRK